MARNADAPILVLALGILCVAAVGSPPLAPWQDEGHLLVNQVAAERLPEEMPVFLRDAVDRLAYLGPEPDRWRRDSEFTLKESQEPDHFIKLEILDVDLNTVRSRYDYYRMLYERRSDSEARRGVHADSLLPEHVGLLPYITIELYERLKVAFRQYRALALAGGDTELVEGNIILYAGWLGHYVADAANPHHTSIHFDGWQGPNPEAYAGSGVHGRFEGDFIRGSGIGVADVTGRVGPPRRLEDPFAHFVKLLHESQRLVEETYRIDKDGGFAGAGSARAREFALGRLVAASQVLLNYWYTAWMDSAG